MLQVAVCLRQRIWARGNVLAVRALQVVGVQLKHARLGIEHVGSVPICASRAPIGNLTVAFFAILAQRAPNMLVLLDATLGTGLGTGVGGGECVSVVREGRRASLQDAFVIAVVLPCTAIGVVRA